MLNNIQLTGKTDVLYEPVLSFGYTWIRCDLFFAWYCVKRSGLIVIEGFCKLMLNGLYLTSDSLEGRSRKHHGSVLDRYGAFVLDLRDRSSHLLTVGETRPRK